MRAMRTDRQANDVSLANVVRGPVAAPLPPFGAEAAWTLYMSNPAVAEHVDLVATRVARLDPRVATRKAGFDTMPIDDILSYPGLNRSRQQLVREIATRMLVTGTAFILLTGRHDRPPLALDVIDPAIVGCAHGPDGWPTFYRLRGDPGLTFGRVVLTRSNLGYVNPGIGELVPVLEMAGNANGLGLSRLAAIWPLLAGPLAGDDVALRAALRRRLEIPHAFAPGDPSPGAVAAGNALHHDVVLPLFTCIYAALARAFSDRWNEDIRIEADTASGRLATERDGTPGSRAEPG